jgi:hypothetical protein
MIKNFRFCGIAAVVTAATALTSCYYDPYFTSVGATYGSSYSSGYYGGGRGYSSSVFISTGSPEWGYDPHCYSYYNYHRRCYYDPYLNGFYPVGYRPPVFTGCAHPYGWRPGARYCPPPRRVSNITIVNYRNRESAYHRAGYINHSHRKQYQYGGNRYSRDSEQQHRSKPYSGNYRKESRTGLSAFNTSVSHAQQQMLDKNPSSGSIQTSTQDQSQASSQPQIAEPTASSGSTKSDSSPSTQSSEPSIVQAPPSPTESTPILGTDNAGTELSAKSSE